MAVYEYRAFDLDASAVSGTVVADTPRQARDVLRDKGLTVSAVKAVRDRRRLLGGRGRSGRRATVAFVRELSTLLGAGIPLLEALQTLIEQHGGRFRAVIQAVADEVAGGVDLAEAMRRHPAWFDELAVSIVAVGENTGSLSAALKRLAEFKEKADRLRSRIVTALMYPSVVLAVGLLVCVFLMTHVVPDLLSALVREGRELPAITRFVKGCSDLLLGWWWLLLGGVAAAAVGVAAALRGERLRYLADRLILRVPVAGDLIRKENVSRMAVVMSALLRSGLQFTEAVRVTRDTLRNRVLKRAMTDYEQAVTAGSDVAEPLRASGVFSPMVIQMLAVGQKAGQLEDMLDQLAESFDQQVDTATQRLTAVLEPLLIVLLALVVGAIALATILPILEMSNVL